MDFGRPEGRKSREESANTAHADFFNAWDQDELQRLVDGCLNAGVHCGRGFGG